jgi:hypothetical protein
MSTSELTKELAKLAKLKEENQTLIEELEFFNKVKKDLSIIKVMVTLRKYD